MRSKTGSAVSHFPNLNPADFSEALGSNPFTDDFFRFFSCFACCLWFLFAKQIGRGPVYARRLLREKFSFSPAWDSRENCFDFAREIFRLSERKTVKKVASSGRRLRKMLCFFNCTVPFSRGPAAKRFPSLNHVMTNRTYTRFALQAFRSKSCREVRFAFTPENPSNKKMFSSHLLYSFRSGRPRHSPPKNANATTCFWQLVLRLASLPPPASGCSARILRRRS